MNSQASSSRTRAFTVDHLSPQLADRLAKLLGMTGSDHDGECLNAIRLANRVLAENKLTWHEAFQPALPEPEQPKWSRQSDWHFRGTWQDAVRFADRYLYSLPPKEREFIRQLSDYTHAPTEKQQKWLKDIVERLLRQGARQWA